jgi:hypothetical protein
MANNQRYAVQQPQISALLAYIATGEIAIPEIQRPFVWDAIKVRNLLDSLYQGFPVGFIIAWQNPDIKLKDGTSARGKRILIDGQQRVTALMAALMGREVIDRQYRQVRIRIAFNPMERRFEVHNPAIAKNSAWIPDISTVFRPETEIWRLIDEYCASNPAADKGDIYSSIHSLEMITSNQIGLIELSHDLDIETVTEIFIRVNSAGVPLSQADFAMSKIAVNEKDGGNTLRKAIDYFSRLAVSPEFFSTLRNDLAFANTDYFSKISWLKNENEGLYDPTYIDILRVSFTTEFQRGRISDLVALLSGRNFETRSFEESIVEESFARLRNGVMRFINEDSFKKFLLIIKSAGFVEPGMIQSKNSINFAYIMYLTMRDMGLAANDIERLVRRWFVMTLLTGRATGSFETQFEQDVRQIRDRGAAAYSETVLNGELSDAFWTVTLPEALTTAAGTSQAFRLYLAAQVKLLDKGFLSHDIHVKDLVEVKSDIHHFFPKDFLKRNGYASSQYNQVANYVVAQSEINISIGNKEPAVYLAQIREQVTGGMKKYGNIVDLDELKENLRMNCIPDGVESMGLADYPIFLEERRKLMAQKIRTYFENL